MLPNAVTSVYRAQDAQKKAHDHHVQLRTFTTADPVFVRNFGNKTPLWLIGHIKEQTGPLSYQITLDDGRVIRHHVDHIAAEPVSLTNLMLLTHLI